MRDAFIRGMMTLAEQDRRVVLLTGDLGFKLFDNFAARFRGRFYNAGVAEANMMGVAGGLALGGLRPFAYSIVPFATLRCLEQIRNDICYQEAAVTVVGVGGGYSYGANGPTHHSLEDIAVMRCLPNMTVVCPGDPVEAELATRAAGAHAGPLYLRLGRARDAVVHGSVPPFSIGRAIVVREGGDCVLIATGGILPVAVAAAAQLAGEGIGCRVVSMHTVKPLDEALLEPVRGGIRGPVHDRRTRPDRRTRLGGGRMAGCERRSLPVAEFRGEGRVRAPVRQPGVFPPDAGPHRGTDCRAHSRSAEGAGLVWCPALELTMGRTPSPVWHRLMRTPRPATLSPKGARARKFTLPSPLWGRGAGG